MKLLCELRPQTNTSSICLKHGFLRVQCEPCHDEKLVVFSCKRRGFCPSCGARRMANSAALLVDDVLPHQPMCQWVAIGDQISGWAQLAGRLDSLCVPAH